MPPPLQCRDASPIARRFFNTLADEPEVVASALVPRIKDMQVMMIIIFAEYFQQGPGDHEVHQ